MKQFYFGLRDFVKTIFYGFTVIEFTKFCLNLPYFIYSVPHTVRENIKNNHGIYVYPLLALSVNYFARKQSNLCA